MDVFEALSALTTTPGVTGNEVAVSEVVKGNGVIPCRNWKRRLVDCV